MINFPDYLFAIVAIVYGLFGVGLLIYTDRLSKKIKEQQELERNRRASQCKFACQQENCTAKYGHTEEASALLGVVWPPVGDKND